MIRLCVIIALAAACGFAPTIAPPPPAPPAADSKPAPHQAGNLAHCLRLLKDEAEKSKVDGTLVRNSADFARTFGEPPPQPALLEKLTRRIDRDPFVDAYMRWQLTSFNPPAFEMTDVAFERLVQTLPAPLENPRADLATLESLQRASARGALSEPQQKEVNDRLNALAAQASRADALNQPALQFRAWLVDRFKKQPHRMLTLMLDEARALAKAGWPVEEAKAEIDKTLETASRLRDFTADQRRDFLLAAENSTVKARMYAASAGVSDNALYANYATTGIFDYDVRRWARALDDER